MQIAQVRAFAVNSDGSNGATLGGATTSSAGTFTINMQPHSGPVRLTASGGTFVSEMDGATIGTVAPVSKISALLADGSTKVSGISINPLSDFVNSLTLGEIAQGSSLSSALSSATFTIETDYGLSADPATIAPDYTAANLNTNGGRLGLVLGALINEDQNLCPASPGGLVAALSADISDGVFDGIGPAGVISYCGGKLTELAGISDFRDALSGTQQLALVTAGFGFGETFGPAGNVLFGETPAVAPDQIPALVRAIDSGLGGAAPQVPNAVADGPNMVAAREGATATLLQNGKVLIAGGFTGGGTNQLTFLKSTEIYDPVGNSFASSPPAMISTEFGHTATLLPNGKVLIAGPRVDTELYNPVTGAFESGPTMSAAPRFSATATLLPNGKVLIAGGTGLTGPLNSTELYDPVSNTFASALSTASMATHRVSHTATLLPNGKVLIAGGYDNSNPINILSSTELYDPATNTFSAGPSMNIGRFSAGASIFLDGTKVLIAGGDVSAGTNRYMATATVEQYDSVAGTFFAAPLSMTAPKLPIVILTPIGFTLLVDNNALDESTELYNGITTFFDAGPNIFPRQGETATLLPNGNVLVAGGLTLAFTETNTTQILTVR